MRPLRIATQNQGKLKEFKAILEPLGFEIVGLEDLGNLDIQETGQTFEANAIIKAETITGLTGDWVIADDSGLVVDALGGAPGIYSARYANTPGPNQDSANNQKLLEALKNIPAHKRTARFVCAIALCRSSQPPVTFSGQFEGAIGFEERGNGGFGYDPLFLVEGDTRTSAELTSTEKNNISHRGKALRQLASFLKT
ncbi:MAG: XTP/dITP diphosphatase [Myxococcota bacterium]|nr:XTP/dITP diphosphatase [Myxococcota bacterium]